MTTEEIINQVKALVEKSNCTCAVAVSSAKEEKVSVCLRGNEQEVGGCLITMLGGGQISQDNLAVLGAYCIAQAKGLAGFADANKFSNYLMGCADMYFHHSSLIPDSKKGLS